jgi:hypothetical protein
MYVISRILNRLLWQMDVQQRDVTVTSRETRRDDRGSQNAWEQSQQGGTTSYGTDTAAWRRSWHGFKEQLAQLPSSAGTASQSSWHGFQEQLARLQRGADSGAVLRIRIRDPVPFWPLDHGYVFPDPGSQILNSYFWVKSSITLCEIG